VVAVVISLAFSLTRTRLYQGTSRVLLQSGEGEQVFDSPSAGQLINPERALGTELELVKNLPPPDDLGAASSRIAEVSATADQNTDLIKVQVKSPDPELAARAANAYAAAYVEARRQRTVESLQAVAKQLEGRVAELEDQINASARPTPPQQVPNTRRDALVDRQEALKEKLDQVQVESSVTTGGARIASPARVPSSPAEPQPVRNGILAGAIGLGLGLGLAFLLDQLDDRIKSRDQLNPLISGLPVLGILPIESPGVRKQIGPVVLTHPESSTAEAYRSLRTSVQVLGVGGSSRVLQVTSPNLGEGKTTIVANLAVALSKGGSRVAVVCCDQRRPQLYKVFGLDNGVGFSSVLREGVRLEDALQSVPGEPRMSVLTAGPRPPNPSEWLSTLDAEKVFVSLRELADVVLVDSPPLLPVTDAAILSGLVDGTLLVVSSGLTRKRHLRRSFEILAQVDASVVGVVLNRAGGNEGGYGSQYYYSAENKQTGRHRLARR
jgi:capsular exopolysaccharide synthesis family protein